MVRDQKNMVNSGFSVAHKTMSENSQTDVVVVIKKRILAERSLLLWMKTNKPKSRDSTNGSKCE